jgi:branched-chain amino acid aminotransferase
MHRFVLHNGEIKDSGDRFLSAGQVGLLNGWGVFSTVRVYQGVLFAWERHWARMERDARVLRVPFPTDSQALAADLNRLVDANQAWDATMRVSVVRNRGGIWEGPAATPDFDVIGFTAEVRSWAAQVKLGLVPHARHAANEFAGTKILSWAENLTRFERAREQGLDEVILLNERGEVCECTGANIFVVHGNIVRTPPVSSGCLPGVTRALLLEEISVPGLEVREAILLPPDLESADEVLVTSTTRGLLPVVSITGLKISHKRGPAGGRLRSALSTYMESYVAARRRSIPSAQPAGHPVGQGST